jgi:hypothetical protein
MDTAGITDQRKQIPVGVTELSGPIHIPIGLTIEPGNLNNQTHFKMRCQQIQPAVNGSLVIFDTGANRIDHTR